jgi:hypothetical protein
MRTLSFLLALYPILLTSQPFYKSGNPIADGWTSSSANHILSSTQTASSGYSESNTSPNASGSNNVRFNNCTPSGASHTLTSPIISTVGRSNIRIGFGRRKSSTAAPSTSLDYFDGSSWATISSDVRPAIDDAWSTIYFDLPPGASNNNQLKFRFTLLTSVTTGCAAAANFRIDDFWVGANNKLPIEANWFDITLLGDKRYVKWHLRNSTVAYLRHIWRSPDGKIFQLIRQDTIDPSTPWENQHFLDHALLSGNVYYKVCLKDLGQNQERCSDIKMVQIISHEIKLYPNPVVDEGFIELPIDWKKATWILTNAQGQLVQKGIRRSDETIRLSFTSYPTGLYILTMNNGMQVKIIKIQKI